MKRRRVCGIAIGALCLQLLFALPSFAGDYEVSDISLVPGADETQLNITWHSATGTDGDECKVKIGKTGLFSLSSTFTGALVSADVDENDDVDYYCEVVVSGLEEGTGYAYRLGDTDGNWTDKYEYTTRDTDSLTFIFVGDPQIGASRDEDEDTLGWTETLAIMMEQQPETAFLLSAGDQVEDKDDEVEYTGLFAPEELTSLPMAPTIGSHDRAENFDYHFNLPNESSDYGVNTAGGDYYFTYGNTLIMVLNMDASHQAYSSGGGGAPPSGGGGPGDSGDSSNTEETDTDGDGIVDDNDLCPEVSGESEHGCPLTADYDDDEDGVTNDADECYNTKSEWVEDGLISAITGCPYSDTDSDGVPDEDSEGTSIDRCNNTYDDLTVDEDGCADCGYLETKDELEEMVSELENSCETDETTGEEVCTDELEDYKASLEEHKTFMEEAIAANPDAKWKFVMWHYSIYSAASHSTDDELEVLRYLFTPTLEELDIDVVLMGHDHAYTRTYQMADNEPLTDRALTDDGMVVNPDGIVYLTGSSSSGSKFYSLNCNIEDATSSSNAYYDYAASWYEQILTYTTFTVDDDSLELKTYTYTLGDSVGSYGTELIDEYAILSDDDYEEVSDKEEVTDDSTEADSDHSHSPCFITSLDSESLRSVAFVFLASMAAVGAGIVSRKKED